MSLSEDMRLYAAKNMLRLHTPGHKGSENALDITELTDDSFPKSALDNAQKNIAKAYGTRHSFLLSCGSSQGVKASIYYAACDGIADINSHRSVFDGFEFSGKKCVTAGKHGVMPLTVADLKKSLTSSVKAVIVTSPTYYGFCADLPSIAEFCRQKGLLFIVDGAHGAHFGFSPRLPSSPTKIADICNLSAHKTLSALTQSAMLFDNLSDADSQKLSECVALMGTTSPSYLLYSSVERAVEKAQMPQTAAAYEALYNPISELKKSYPFLANDDFTRLVLDCGALNLDAKKLNAELVKNGVMSELVTDRYIVFIFTAADVPDSVEMLDRALHSAKSRNKII